MKRILFFALCWLCGCTFLTGGQAESRYKMQTERQEAYYLSIDAEKVQDTCPGNDILKQYTCSKEQADGFTCFDVYVVQGRPANVQEYTLLQETVNKQALSPQPRCPEGMQPHCDSFLKALNYNLEFSWYLVDFPSSSFPQCRETYDCKRIDCYQPTEVETESTLISCVYKRNQIFFVGSDITCRQKAY